MLTEIGGAVGSVHEDDDVEKAYQNIVNTIYVRYRLDRGAQ
ncbi:hypothetical protein BIFGAL_02950 [Bifidobacterium gallicum DSM 20093 = LMG 11596]|uniref:Uncharacterized protein n=1 Tax=Bifidobacterium gallicum DSM 20093 = LMG 11596 TaxID=561180 RepID=D1NT39_9BIFI|nr:hypothetical protein BIFGAL_02950 [Bifidobacterium gallicum DSM 20093 = LMG 11596]